MEENEELFDNDCQEPMAPAIIEKSIIIDFSHKILLSISIYIRYNQLIIIDFYQKLSVIDFIDCTHRASPRKDILHDLS